YIHPFASSSVPRWSGNPNVQHDNVALCRVVGHRIGSEYGFIICHNKIPHAKFIPVPFIYVLLVAQVWVRRDVHIGKRYGALWHIYLYITSRLEIQSLAFWQPYHKFFYKCRYVVVRNNFTFPLLDTKNLFRNTYL